MDTGGRRVKLGDREVTFPSEYLNQLQPVQPSEERDVLLQRLQRDGYLFLKQLHDRDEVLAARQAVIQYIAGSGEGKFDQTQPLEKGVLNPRCGLGCVPYMEGRNDITHNHLVKKVLEGERPKTFFKKLLQDDVQTFDYKWLRGVYREGFTGAHMDSVYMSWGTKNLYTMWTPFDDIPVEMGTLAMCHDSHNLPRPLQETYGDLDVEKSGLKGTGWFTTNPFEITDLFGGQWKTSDFQAGDVLIFTMRTIHMSTVNCTDKIRISCDTRWLRASEDPDPRFVGDCVSYSEKFGVWAKTMETDEDVTMEKMKEKWGFKYIKMTDGH